MAHSASWGQPGVSGWGQAAQRNSPTVQEVDAEPVAQPASSWGQSGGSWGQAMVPAQNQTVAQPNAGQWGQQGASWGQLVQPAIVGQTHMRDVTDISKQYVAKSAEGNGALSYDTHQRQMQVVDKALNTMVLQVEYNAQNIQIIVKKFMDLVQETNKKITQYCSAIIDRGTRGDPTLSADEVLKATAIMTFATSSVKVMNESSELALNLADKGASIITKQTQNAIGAIFDARMKEVALFAQKVEIFHKQEEHDLKIMLQIQDARLKEQAQLFAQMKEVVQIETEREKVHFSQQMEVRKAQVEQALQMKGMELKAQEVQNTKDVQVLEQNIKERLGLQAIQSTERVQKIDIASKERVAVVQSENQKWAAIADSNNKRDVAFKQSEDQKQVGMFKAATEAAKPACVIS